jgi:hypothetical protein
MSYVTKYLENERSNKPNSLPSSQKRWNQFCNMCKQEITNNSSLAVCDECFEKGKEAGWFDDRM